MLELNKTIKHTSINQCIKSISLNFVTHNSYQLISFAFQGYYYCPQLICKKYDK